MNILELLATKTAKGITTAAKDTGKATEKTGLFVAKEMPTVAGIALEVAPVIVPEVSPVLSVAEKISGLVARPISSEALPASNPVSKSMAAVFTTAIFGEKMNSLESFAITMVLGVLQTVIKNPAHKAALESQLVGIADQIYMTYGLPVPAPASSAPAPAASH